MSVWVEISSSMSNVAATMVTLHVSVWVEIYQSLTKLIIDFVTLHVSVWVEIGLIVTIWFIINGHAPRERVSWNWKITECITINWRHAPRERVSWNQAEKIERRADIRHAPRERVSWNDKVSKVFLGTLVTLHVSVWVEIRSSVSFFNACSSRSTWACELKCCLNRTLRWGLSSRSTWACELKWFLINLQKPCTPVTLHVSVWVEILFILSKILISIRHAPRERVSWNDKYVICGYRIPRHAPRERVSWNVRSTM